MRIWSSSDSGAESLRDSCGIHCQLDVNTSVYTDLVLLCGGPSLRGVQRPEFDTWRNLCLDVKMACKDEFGKLLLKKMQQGLSSRMQRTGRI